MLLKIRSRPLPTRQARALRWLLSHTHVGAKWTSLERWGASHSILRAGVDSLQGASLVLRAIRRQRGKRDGLIRNLRLECNAQVIARMSHF